MNMDNEIKERKIELRSEKVRSIVGQMPSALINYGTIIIGLILIFILWLTYNLPYKQIYTGVANVCEVKTYSEPDSVNVSIILESENVNIRPDFKTALISLHSTEDIRGRILFISPECDTLNRQKAICRFKVNEIQELTFQSVDYSINAYYCKFLSKIFEFATNH